MLVVVRRAAIVGLLWAAGCQQLESQEAQEVARVTRKTVERGLDGASAVADQAAKATQEQLDRVDLDKLRRAWDAAVRELESTGPSEPSAPEVDPLADAATAITCDEAMARCTVTADFADRARHHAGRVAGQVRVSPATGSARGVRIDWIEAGTLGTRVGLRAGDVVTHVNGVALGSPQDAMMLYMSVRSATRFEVTYRRGSEDRTLVVEVV